MAKSIITDADKIYNHFKRSRSTFEEEKHCKLLINVMTNKDKGTMSAFCVDAMICESTFYNWVHNYPLFSEIYHYCKMIAREVWEQEGRALRDMEYPIGTINHAFEYWKLIGWSRFGISKNSRIKLTLNPAESPAKHYESIIRQAQEGDFTAAEFKQLMEAVNVGINVQQVYELQRQIDELKSDLTVMAANTNVKNPFTDKGVA